MINLESIKEYLRIDFDDDDAFINMLIEASDEYIQNAVDFKISESKLKDLMQHILISHWYETRQFTTTEKNVDYMVKSMMTQLRNCYEEEADI